jgi:hypothetical protein
MKRRNLVPPNQPQQRPQQPQQMGQQQRPQQIVQQQQRPPQQFVQNNGPITSIRGQSSFNQQQQNQNQPPTPPQQQQRVSFQKPNIQQPKNELLSNIEESQIKYAPKLTIPNAITLLSLRVGRNENSIQELLHHKQNMANVDNNTIDDSVFKNIVERLSSIEKSNVELLLTLNKTQNELDDCRQELTKLQEELVMYSTSSIQDEYEGEEQGGEGEFELNQDENCDEPNVIVFDTNVIELVITETEQPQPTEEIVSET